jgi:DNA mismatch repair protein MutS
MLEQGARDHGAAKIQIDDLPLFASAPAPQPRAPIGPSAVETLLDNIHPDDLSPKEALDALYRLKDAAQ